jgi:hypothetical protein
VPLILLTPVGIDPAMRLLMSRKTLRERTDGHRRRNAALAGSVTRGEHRALEGARHSTIHTDRPDAVVQAIRDLLDRIENGVAGRHDS